MHATVNHITTPQSEKIGFGERFSYGLGDLANNVVFTGVGTFMVFFYTDVAGIWRPAWLESSCCCRGFSMR